MAPSKTSLVLCPKGQLSGSPQSNYNPPEKTFPLTRGKPPPSRPPRPAPITPGPAHTAALRPQQILPTLGLCLRKPSTWAR